MPRAIHRFRMTTLLLASLSTSPAPHAAAADAELPVDQLPICQLIATGGTIAMKIDPAKNAPVPALSGEDLLASVPELAKVANVHVENLFNIPSHYMDPDRWVALHDRVAAALARDEVAGVMITHGTD